MTQSLFTQIVRLAIINREGHLKLATQYFKVFNDIGGEAPLFAACQTSSGLIEYKRHCQEMAALHTLAVGRIDTMLHYLETNTDF